MKTLPRIPYIDNIFSYYQKEKNNLEFKTEYKIWLKQFGFAVPVKGNYLEFPDDFSDEDLFLFMLR